MDGSRAVILMALVACSSKSQTPPDVPPPPPEAPLRDATGDADVRILVADLLAGRACDQAVHHFGGLRDKLRKQVITGDVWIRDCKITNEGTKVTVEISGNGWQWIEKSQKKGGATFDVRQYVKFAVTAKLSGVIDVAYDPPTHIVSLWFTPSGGPAVDFVPIGEIEVYRDSAWASAIGDLGSLIGDSPEAAADTAATDQGKQTVTKAAANGAELRDRPVPEHHADHQEADAEGSDAQAQRRRHRQGRGRSAELRRDDRGPL